MSRVNAADLGRSIAGRVLGGVAAFDPGRRDVVGILTYHRIVDADAVVPPGIASATPDGFARQMAMLASAYHPISLGELMQRADGGPALPRRSVLVTFDDAYPDTARVAWPILRELRIPAALFVPTALPETNRRFWWSRLHGALRGAAPRATWMSPIGPLPLVSEHDRTSAYRLLRAQIKRVGHAEGMAMVDAVEAELGSDAGGAAEGADPSGDVLSWAELRALAAEGMGLAAHSRTHPLLTKIPATSLDEEIGGSLDDLAAGLGQPRMTAFAYPSGAYSATVRGAAARNGVKVAFTTDRGLNDLDRCDWLAMRRINVGMRMDPAWLRAQLGSRLGPLVAAVVERRGQGRHPAGTNDPAPAGRD